MKVLLDDVFGPGHKNTLPPSMLPCQMLVQIFALKSNWVSFEFLPFNHFAIGLEVGTDVSFIPTLFFTTKGELALLPLVNGDYHMQPFYHYNYLFAMAFLSRSKSK